MVQIIEENKRPTFAEKLNLGVGRGLEFGQQLMQEHQQGQAVKNLLGSDYKNLSPEMQKLALEYHLKGNVEERKQAAKFAQQMQMMKQLGLDFGGQEESEPKSETADFNPANELEETSKLGSITSKKTKQNLIPEQKIAAMALVNPAIADKWQKHNDNVLAQTRHEETLSQKNFNEERDYHTKVSAPILKEAESILKEVPIKKGLINQQRRDIASGETAGIIPFLVEKTGLEAYRNPESARFKTISKQRFIESLHALGASGARANQFIEQQLTSAQPSLGRDEEANQTVLDLEEFIDDMKAARARFEIEEAEKDEKLFGFAKNDIARRADKKMNEYAEKRQEEMAYDIRKRHENKLSDQELIREIIGNKVSADTPLTLRTARILMIKNNDNEEKAQSEARKLGFTIPGESTYFREHL